MNPADRLVHCTVRIATEGPEGRGSGTGFLFRFAEENGWAIPAIVTNKHVIDGADKIEFLFHRKKEGLDEPDLQRHWPVTVQNAEDIWIRHPDPKVDLAIFPISEVIHEVERSGVQLFLQMIGMSNVASEAILGGLSTVSNILMIGYPNGLADTAHNLPLARRGITASHPRLKFQGKPEFVIDCACFPGSSGSPVFLYDSPAWLDEKNVTRLGVRAALIGILWGGPMFDAEGEIVYVPVPTALKPVAVSRIPLNLGLCVMANELKVFDQRLRELAAAGLAPHPKDITF